MEISFSIENDILIMNKVVPDPEIENRYIIDKKPIISKDVFIECFNRWIKIEPKSQEE